MGLVRQAGQAGAYCLARLSATMFRRWSELDLRRRFEWSMRLHRHLGRATL
jgi:hypothetical protein